MNVLNKLIEAIHKLMNVLNKLIEAIHKLMKSIHKLMKNVHKLTKAKNKPTKPLLPAQTVPNPATHCLEREQEGEGPTLDRDRLGA